MNALMMTGKWIFHCGRDLDSALQKHFTSRVKFGYIQMLVVSYEQSGGYFHFNPNISLNLFSITDRVTVSDWLLFGD